MTFTDFDTIKALSEARSHTRGTTLVTMYVPGGANISSITADLNAEKSSSSNIKNPHVGKSVKSALNSALYVLKNYVGHNAPENGFVLCAGEIGSCV